MKARVSTTPFDEVRHLLAPPVKQPSPIVINAMRKYREYRTAQLSAAIAEVRKNSGSAVRHAKILAVNSIYDLIPEDSRM